MSFALAVNRISKTQSPLPPQLPRDRSALNDAADLAAELAVDDRPPRDKGELVALLDLLRSGQMAPGLARDIVALVEDRRAFWARFDAEFPDRVRISLDGLRHDLSRLRRDCAPGSPLDTVIVALAKTIRHFFDLVEPFDLTTLRCDGGDPEWLAFEAALRALRKSVGYQIAELAASYSIPLQGEFAEQIPK